MDVVYVSPGSTLSGADLESELAVVGNQGEASVDVAGWTLSDAEGNSFAFPPGTVLAAHEVLVVWTGSGVSDSRNLYWGRIEGVWDTADAATLRDAAGRLVHVLQWSP